MRFKRVEDVRKLERQLDNLIITGLKLHANLPKHEREQKLTRKTNITDQFKKGHLRDKLAEQDEDIGRLKTTQCGTEEPGSIILNETHFRFRMRKRLRQVAR